MHEQIMKVLATHRWKSMSVQSVECECGVVVVGDAALTTFPADEAFRSHLADEITRVIDGRG